MSEQAIDLRSAWHLLRRRTGVLVLAAALGPAGGAALVYLRPPEFTSTSKVLLPPAPEGSTAAATAHSIDTQVQIAQSQKVLGPAGKAVNPVLNATEVAKRVDVESETSDVIVITAKGPSPEEAQALCDAVAKAEIAYLEEAASTNDDETRSALAQREQTLRNSLDTVTAQLKATQGRLKGADIRSASGRADAAALAQLAAQQADLVLQLDKVESQIAATQGPTEQAGTKPSVIEDATPAKRAPLVLTYAIYGGGGAALLVALVALVIVLRARREQTVRSRDQIADAIGIPVVASLQCNAPRSVAAWTSLLANYVPHNVETWTLRQLVRMVTPGHAGSLAGADEDSATASVLVLTISGDSQALAVGPQVASFGASTGLRTQLVPAQMHESANALWAACAAVPPQEQIRPGLAVDTRRHVNHKADLVVQLAVMDRARPDLHAGLTGVTLLAVTAGAATAEDLARVALAADDAGHPIARIVVVNPDPFDRSTGRLLPAERASQIGLPSLLTGSEIAMEATTLESRRRRR
jgi:capsular polysaccharide biosynthesis protein